MYIEMKVYGFALDPIAQMPVVILKDADGEQTVPVWIGAAESISFAAEFIGREAAGRNGRKDVFTALLERLQMTVAGIYLESVQDGVFTTSVRVQPAGGDELRLEVHVSEAMLLSLKYRKPVLVNPDLLSQVSQLDMSEDSFADENNARRFVDFLDQLDPSSMNKYPM
ncbi:bifunctional nuclease family protein [Geomesophilobacter sediminis]|uniref:Bifunctional nuclease family protein n=1 Tax=Geomesophilobacter sediminis TaxID=2798584 RepID=A0A8J7M326_9BACT|nr:bifunctional nuclease family protein [Geomesophilobacter sediminis]MBJ6727742.1 bifunctional nuclease family protein [Geomesophilobacter sediminis]